MNDKVGEAFEKVLASRKDVTDTLKTNDTTILFMQYGTSKGYNYTAKCKWDEEDSKFWFDIAEADEAGMLHSILEGTWIYSLT